MTHWTEAYLGIPYADATDCAALVQRVAGERFGIRLALPTDRDWRRMNAPDVHALAVAVATPTDAPQDGDGVLMRLFGDLGYHRAHVGVYAAIGARPWVLHSTELAGSHLTPLSCLRSEFIEVVGFYRWNEGERHAN